MYLTPRGKRLRTAVRVTTAMLAATLLAMLLSVVNIGSAHATPVAAVQAVSHPSTYTWGGKQQNSRVGTPGVWELDASNGSQFSTFKLQGDGNLVLTANGHVAWASGTNGKLTATGYLYFADTGEMILYASQYGGVVWSDTGTSSAADYYAVVPAICSGRVLFARGFDVGTFWQTIRIFGSC